MPEMKTAQEFMRRKLVTLAPETNVVEGVARLLGHNISGAPVIDAQGGYLGVFSEKCSINALTATIELADQVGLPIGRAREVMTSDLTTLSTEIDVFEAIDHILSKRISGAPVVDERGTFLGIFSEKTAMRVLLASAYDQFPGSKVGLFMNTDRQRIVDEDTPLLDVAHRFQQTPYRRLPVLRGDRLEGQISRRDVLRAEHRIAVDVAKRIEQGDNRFGTSTTTGDVASFMDRDAKTTGPHEDLLTVAQIFLSTPYRRMPVVLEGRLIGQISRRDLLEAAAALLRPKTKKPQSGALYLSPLSETLPPSIG